MTDVRSRRRGLRPGGSRTSPRCAGPAFSAFAGPGPVRRSGRREPTAPDRRRWACQTPRLRHDPPDRP
ncbi:hypothetical protein AMK11_06710 [Streptomyces sp. CB02414]|nr:hypothetical protein AMK11_06710 [Streptomyces sp. CB02414]